jgi:hypothetical protein
MDGRKRLLSDGIGTIFVLLLTLAFVPVVNAEIADHVVISEVQIADSEFVELYNPTNSDINMTGWHWCYFSSDRNWNNSWRDKAFPSGAVIPTHGFYLIVVYGNVSVSPDWNLSYAGPQLHNSNGSVGIFPWDPDTKTLEEAEAGRIDAVAWGSVSYVKEGTEATAPGSGKSLQRKVNDTINESAGYGPAWDSNNNSADFFIQTSPNPQNSGASPVPPLPELPSIALLSIGLLILAWYLILKRRKE